MSRPTTVLIFAYYSYLDPVFQSAVLPYFEGLSGKGDFRFILMTFEQERYAMTEAQNAEAQAFLQENNIVWHRLHWHSGRFKLLKKAYDFAVGVLGACYLVVRNGVSAIYSEGFPGAILGHFVARLTGRRHVVHTFEPHADSCIESGEWSEDSWEARLLKFFEGRIAHGASALLSGTDAYAAHWKARGCSTPFFRVPSCVDVEFFRFNPEARVAIRERLAVDAEDKLIVYLGKFGGMYWESELGLLFQAFEEALKERAHFLVITIETEEVVERCLAEGDFDRRRLTVLRARREEVPGLLSAGTPSPIRYRWFASGAWQSASGVSGLPGSARTAQPVPLPNGTASRLCPEPAS